jgi:putative membrane protein
MISNAVFVLFAGSLLLSACASVEEVMPLMMSHANVLAVLDTVDEMEVDAGELGKNKAASPSVRSFASRLIQEHRGSIQGRKRLAEKMDVEPQKPQLAEALELRRMESKSLLENKSGRDFDEAYIRDQIMVHEQMVKLLQDTEDSMDEPDLRQHLRFSQPDLLSHLSAARAAERQLLAQQAAE